MVIEELLQAPERMKRGKKKPWVSLRSSSRSWPWVR